MPTHANPTALYAAAFRRSVGAKALRQALEQQGLKLTITVGAQPKRCDEDGHRKTPADTYHDAAMNIRVYAGHDSTRALIAHVGVAPGHLSTDELGAAAFADAAMGNIYKTVMARGIA